VARVLFVLHDAPYGVERVYNALRWAKAVLVAGEQVRVFLFGDAVVAGVQGQHVAEGYYNTGKQIESLVRRGSSVGLCGTCMDARGIDAVRLLAGTHRSSMDELAEWTHWADKVINV
jgi:uncharacterized protein involved in oxidation of intracellular sulfur